MNISIGNNRWVKFARRPDGVWGGRGHGYRFQVERVLGSRQFSEQWRCRVWRDKGGPVIAGCLFSKMKSAIQEGARRADVATTEAPCPT
jgi:hypothetical protein